MEDTNDLCRDFLRNICRRGTGCRYRHPDREEAIEFIKKMKFVFCHDFQNRECRRENCRFLHCTKQEEEKFRTSGKLPDHFFDKVERNKSPEILKNSVGDSLPVCKDNLKGDCRRGSGRCKFRHISQAELEVESKTQTNGSIRIPHRTIVPQSIERYDAPPEPKRRAYDPSLTGHFYTADRVPTIELTNINANTIPNDFDFCAKALIGHVPQAVIPHQTITRLLEEDNCALRRRIEELNKQVADLMATNEFLLEQNAQLRTMGKPGPTSAPQPAAPQAAPPPPPLGPTALAPVSNELLASSLASSPVVSAAIVASLTSLSTPLTAQGGLPVSSIAALPTSVISTSTTPLVSYPIMTAAIQTLRPPIPHSLSH